MTGHIQSHRQKCTPDKVSCALISEGAEGGNISTYRKQRALIDARSCRLEGLVRVVVWGERKKEGMQTTVSINK